MSEQNRIPVSVIIPCYRCAATIERTIASVWKQTRRPAEVILVEDRSPDNGQTLEALRNIQSSYGGDWIKIIVLPSNQGAGNARNAGWNEASQPYVAFLDADDAWHPRKLEIQHACMAENPHIALLGHDYRQLTPDAGIAEELPERWPAGKLDRSKLLRSNQMSTPTVMIRRDLPFRFQADKRYSEDYLLWLQVMMSGREVWKIGLPLAYLFKAPYGEGGLSGRLWEMEKGELGTYLSLYREGSIRLALCLGLSGASFVKYVMRWWRIRLKHLSGA